MPWLRDSHGPTRDGLVTEINGWLMSTATYNPLPAKHFRIDKIYNYVLGVYKLSMIAWNALVFSLSFNLHTIVGGARYQHR